METLNYKVITDEALLLEFINWLPDLEENETYYLCLFSRNKYCSHVKHISSDKSQLKRFTANKNNMFDKIKQLEIQKDCYYQVRNNTKISIPQEALVLYITINPRDMMKATFESIKHLTNCIQQNNKGFNPYQEVLSQIQKQCSRKEWIDFDIDTKEIDLSLLNTMLKPNTYRIVETRGGYHILVSPNRIKLYNSIALETENEIIKNTWYKQLIETFNVDQKGDNMIPVIGCYQGGFTPKFIQI